MSFPARPTWRRRGAVVTLVGALLGAGAGLGYVLSGHRPDDSPGARQADVAARGAQVMPFDLDRTSHLFTDLPDGGVQVVVAHDPDDADQVRLIREHLRHEAAAFARGDFSDPAAIHGHDMPGLGTLRDGADQITVRYQDLAAGAQLIYTTDDPALVEALHHWFAAQVSDHGRHAGRG